MRHLLFECIKNIRWREREEGGEWRMLLNFYKCNLFCARLFCHIARIFCLKNDAHLPYAHYPCIPSYKVTRNVTYFGKGSFFILKC